MGTVAAAVRPDTRAAVGAGIRDVRVDKGWDQTSLAEAAGIDRSYLSDIERGLHHPTTDVLLRLCGSMQVSLARLARAIDVHMK